MHSFKTHAWRLSRAGLSLWYELQSSCLLHSNAVTLSLHQKLEQEVANIAHEAFPASCDATTPSMPQLTDHDLQNEVLGTQGFTLMLLMCNVRAQQSDCLAGFLLDPVCIDSLTGVN